MVSGLLGGIDDGAGGARCHVHVGLPVDSKEIVVSSIQVLCDVQY